MTTKPDPSTRKPDAAGPADAVDVVARSVQEYSAHHADYTDFNADAMAETTARFAALLSAGSRILDAGCGPGRDLRRFRDAGHQPVGIDLNPDFVAAAARHAPTQLGDLRQLPYADDEFDGVWACASLVHLPAADAARALAELRRVAKPGAPVAVSVKHAGCTGWTDSRHGRRWFQIWNVEDFTSAVETACLTVDSVEVGDVFVDVWARA